MEDDTLELIQRVANERFELYRLAGKQRLTPEQQGRVEEITNQLPILWDSHRRELAAAHTPRKVLTFDRQLRAA